MGTFRHLSAFVALLITAGTAVAQAAGGDWVSYRDAYRAMVVFEKYGKAKNFIQNHLQVIARDRGMSSEGLQLTLRGKTSRLNLPLDATGRAVFPLLKAYYDENAALVLNRAAGQYLFRPRVSIVVQADGVYDAADLRTACEQALAYQLYAEKTLRAKRCTGVHFVYPAGATEPGVRLRKGELGVLPALEGPAFTGDAYEGFRLVYFRFSDAGRGNEIATPTAPLAISPVYE